VPQSSTVQSSRAGDVSLRVGVSEPSNVEVDGRVGARDGVGVRVSVG